MAAADTSSSAAFADDVPTLPTPPAISDNEQVDMGTTLTLKIIGIVFLIFVTVVGNGMVMLAVRVDRTILQLSQSSFLFSMALADALVGIFVVPLALLQIIYHYWPLPPVVCILYRCLDVALCTASILHLCAISMDRFWSLRIDYTRHHRKRNMRIMIGAVWILSVIICLPSALPSKFDLQYLGNYLYTSEEEEQETPLFSSSSHAIISPFYILDNQRDSQISSSRSLLSQTDADVTLVPEPYKSKTVSLPHRPRGNNKVLQAVDDVGYPGCSGPSPFDMLFPTDYDTSTLSNPTDCQLNTAIAIAEQQEMPTVFAMDRYHCTLIDNIFYTFASASMSFYIPLVITIVMNILTYWIARRTAKAAMKRMNASNPAAVMLRATIPTPIKAEMSTTETAHTLQTTKSVIVRSSTFKSEDMITEDNPATSNNNNVQESCNSAEPDKGVDTVTSDLPQISPTSQMGATNSGILVRDNANRKNFKSNQQLSFTSAVTNDDVVSPNNDSSMTLRHSSKIQQSLISTLNSSIASTITARKSYLSKQNEFDQKLKAVRHDKKRRAKQRERKAAAVLIIVTVTFIVCWLPFFVMLPLTRIVHGIPGEIFEATVWLGYVNSAVNPVIYTIFNEEFRRAFVNIFLFRWQSFSRL